MKQLQILLWGRFANVLVRTFLLASSHWYSARRKPVVAGDHFQRAYSTQQYVPLHGGDNPDKTLTGIYIRSNLMPQNHLILG